MATDSPPTPSISNAPISPQGLASLRELQIESGDGVFEELVTIFIAAGVALVGRIKTAAGQNDFSGLKNAAHALKGSSASMGALHLSALCDMLDRTEPDANVNLIEQADKIDAEFQRAKTFLQDELAPTKPRT